MEQKEEGRYIPINKGHFDLDTSERTEEFSRNLAEGWEDEYREYRTSWINLPKKRMVRDYPLLVDIELASVCNLSCPMCYTNNVSFKKGVKKGFMDYGLCTRIIDETAGKVFAVRLSLRGESTLHPNFFDAVRYAKERGVKEVSALTNGSKLDLDFFRKMVNAGIDWITVSIDGIGEEYNEVRAPLTFSDTIRKLRDIKEYKLRKNLSKPVIKAQGIWPSIRPDPCAYYNILAPLVDLVAYNPLIDYLRKDHDIVYEEDFACPQLYQRLVIGSDGNILLCSNDEEGEEILGNAYKDDIYDVWHGEKLRQIRELHNCKGGFMSMDICRHCYYPRKAIPDEEAIVNGRTICIENYVNRKQIAGA